MRFAADDWVETALTWKNKPALTGAPIGELVGGTVPNGVYGTALDASALASLGAGQTTLALTNAGTDSLYVWSRNHAEHQLPAAAHADLQLWAPAGHDVRTTVQPPELPGSEPVAPAWALPARDPWVGAAVGR